MLPRALRNRFPVGKANVQPVVRLVADTTAHAVACGEALMCAADAALCQHLLVGWPGSSSRGLPPQGCPSITRALFLICYQLPYHQWVAQTGSVANAVTDTRAQFPKATEDYFYGSAEVFYGGIHLSWLSIVKSGSCCLAFFHSHIWSSFHLIPKVSKIDQTTHTCGAVSFFSSDYKEKLIEWLIWKCLHWICAVLPRKWILPSVCDNHKKCHALYRQTSLYATLKYINRSADGIFLAVSFWELGLLSW